MAAKNNSVVKLSSLTEKFINDYENENKVKYMEKYYEFDTFRNVPKSCYDEFYLLIFMYKYPWVWKTDKKSDKKIQKEVKKYTLNSVINKIEKTPELYYEIEKYTNETSMDWKCAYFIFSFYLFINATNYEPSWIRSTRKFNI